MLPVALLVIAIPLAAAALAYAVRRWPALEVLVAVLACGAVIALVAQPIDGGLSLFGARLDVDAPLDVLGRELRVRAQERMPLVLLFASAAVIFAMSWRAPQGWPFLPVGLLMLGALSAGLLIRPFVFAALAFEAAAALAALMIQSERNGERTTLGAMRYLITTTLALPLFLGAGFVIDRAGTVNLEDAAAVAIAYGPAVVMIVAGFALILGAIPVFTWVHPVAQDAPPLATAFLATVGVGAAGFLLLQFWQEFPWLQASDLAAPALRTGGLVMLVVAALLGWAQRSFARVVACGVFIEVACVLLMVSSGSLLSVASIGFSTLARAFSLGLLGLGLWRLREVHGSDAFDHVRGSRDLWTTIAIAVGGLSLVGLPGTLGFAARWPAARAYAGTDAEGLVLLLIASGSVAVGLVRGLVAMHDAPRPAVSPAPSGLVGDQMSLFDELPPADEVTSTMPAVPAAAVAQDDVIEGEIVPVWPAALSSRGARAMVGLGVALVLILGVWPSVMAPLAQAAAGQYSFYP